MGTLQNDRTTKSAGYFDKSGGSVAHPLAASIKTSEQPLFARTFKRDKF